MTDHDRRLRMAFELEAVCALIDQALRRGQIAAFFQRIAAAGIGKTNPYGGLAAYGVDAGHNGMSLDTIAKEWRDKAGLRAATLRAAVTADTSRMDA